MKTAGRHQIKSRARFYSLFSLQFFVFALFTSLLLPPALAAQVNINTATAEELTTLPYIGTARARAIVDFRHHHGDFTAIEELLQVDNIGPKSLEAIRPHISLAHQDLAGPEIPSLGHGQALLLADDQYFPVLINFIRSAQQRIDMAMYLFKTSAAKNNKPTQLVTELIKASKRGVQVEIVLENSGYNESINIDNKRVAATLRANQIKVRFDSPNQTTHTKLVVIDNRFCFVGSHNLSQSALIFNHEMSLLLDNSKMAGELTDYIAAIQDNHESF